MEISSALLAGQIAQVLSEAKNPVPIELLILKVHGDKEEIENILNELRVQKCVLKKSGGYIISKTKLDELAQVELDQAA